MSPIEEALSIINGWQQDAVNAIRAKAANSQMGELFKGIVPQGSGWPYQTATNGSPKLPVPYQPTPAATTAPAGPPTVQNGQLPVRSLSKDLAQVFNGAGLPQGSLLGRVMSLGKAMSVPGAVALGMGDGNSPTTAANKGEVPQYIYDYNKMAWVPNPANTAANTQLLDPNSYPTAPYGAKGIGSDHSNIPWQPAAAPMAQAAPAASNVPLPMARPNIPAAPSAMPAPAQPQWFDQTNQTGFPMGPGFMGYGSTNNGPSSLFSSMLAGLRGQ